MRLYPQWSTLPDNRWGPLISATAAIPAPKMLDDLLDKVTLITKLPLKHSFELLEAQKKCTCFSSPKLKLLSFWVLSDETTLKNKAKQIFFFFVGPTIFGLCVMETDLYNSVSTQYKQPLSPCLDFFFCHSSFVTHHSSLLIHHSKIPCLFGIIAHFPSLNIFHTICGLHTCHTM